MVAVCEMSGPAATLPSLPSSAMVSNMRVTHYSSERDGQRHGMAVEGASGVGKEGSQGRAGGGERAAQQGGYTSELIALPLYHSRADVE